jgi:peroxiredoxin Q/BCP
LQGFEVAYFAASCDDADTNRRFAESLELDYPILSDPEKKVARAFGVVTDSRSLPFRWTFIIGKDGKLLHIDKEVSVSTHGADVAAKLKELGVEAKP